MRENLLPFDGETSYLPGYFAPPEADSLFDELNDGLNWSQETARLFGRQIPLPRLTAWYGPTNYTYSGVTHPARPFSPPIQHVCQSIEPVASGLNCVLANLYRDGRDSVAPHSDDEALWGDRATIVSVSFGAARSFVLRHKRSGESVRVELEHGSVLIMSGDTQNCWFHAIPKTRRVVGRRINLTFRHLVGLPV
ncbi:MAG TPA: alpha-ketoglutarate-dependent dioxygenase AlkB [Acidimicrobiales bacterium]|nr:alpha-ketoglutarate-dependent dioxygenase AlkB [Acidimicrobiales bacterium]